MVISLIKLYVQKYHIFTVDTLIICLNFTPKLAAIQVFNNNQFRFLLTLWICQYAV